MLAKHTRTAHMMQLDTVQHTGIINRQVLTPDTGLGLEFRSPARADVDREEDVKLDERGEHEEHGVHGEASAPHRRVQLELVEPKREVQHQQR